MSRAGRSFPEIGGHAAVAFVNTRPMRGPARAELLTAFGDLVDWACQFGLIDTDQARLLASKAPSPEAAQALAHARRLRDALDSWFASGDVEHPGAALAQEIGDALAARAGHLAFAVDGDRPRLVFEGRLAQPSDLVAAIAEIVADLVVGGQASRLRRCEGRGCVLWFIDTSRNRSRHWCRMDRCGARAKAAAYYRRHRDAGNGPPPR